MLKQIELKNFRKHEDLSVQFASGLNVIRGSNEVGKSTLIEGVLYALYGSKALRNTLSDVVTWGKEEKSLSARLVLAVQGQDYVFTRSKAGAECNFTGGRVTGQAEVTNYAAHLLGADAKTASLLMLSSQSGLRGALDDGPAAVSSLMGKLADFDLIDSILEAAASKLSLGSSAAIGTKLLDAEAAMQSAIDAIPDPATLLELQGHVDQGLLRVQEAEKHEADVVQPAMVQADAVLAEAKASIEAGREAGLLASAAAKRVELEQQRLSLATAEAGKRVAPEHLLVLRLRTQNATTIDGQVKAYQTFLSLPAYPVDFWDEPEESFDAEYERLTSSVQEMQAGAKALVSAIAATKRGTITNGKCPTCGVVSLTDEHVQAKNAEVAAEVDKLTAEHTALTTPLSEAQATLVTLRAIEADARRRMEVCVSIYAHVVIHPEHYPPKVTWKGDIPVAADLAGLRSELQQAEATERAAAQAEGRVSALVVAVADAKAAHESALRHAESFAAVDLAPMEEAYRLVSESYNELAASLRTLRATVASVTLQKSNAEAEGERAAVAVSAARARVAEYTADIKSLEFNNGLVKKLKLLKPAITDHLWNTVLAAVSNFFSTLRGEQSVVSKDTSGFRVNGQSIDSLSGSTLDVLALAIRVALSKTFIPHASFMVLDEPAHGCDDTRTGNVLGFLSSVGFQQTILASHDELSESVADNVIALEA